MVFQQAQNGVGAERICFQAGIRSATGRLSLARLRLALEAGFYLPSQAP